MAGKPTTGDSRSLAGTEESRRFTRAATPCPATQRMWCPGGDPTYEMLSIGGGRRSLPETARHERFQVVSHVKESGISPPRGQTARGVRDPSTKHERSFDKPFTMVRKAKQIVHSTLDNQPSVQCGFPDWGRGFRDHHRWVPSEAQLIHKSRPNQVLNLSRKGKEDLIESMGLYQ